VLDRYEDALSRLRDTDRELVVARVELGLDVDEIAAAFSKPTPAAARKAVARALMRLAREMDPTR
jgi:DNA-directed RNA polymerase specialized sigma24 family protein